jgi:hypothetical protein
LLASLTFPTDGVHDPMADVSRELADDLADPADPADPFDFGWRPTVAP